MITVWRGSAFNCPSTESHAANQLSLSQKSGGVVNPTAGGSCGNLSAVTKNVSTDGNCYTSVLTIPAVQGLNGTTVMCVDGVTGAVFGNDTVIVKMAGGLSWDVSQYFKISVLNMHENIKYNLPMAVLSIISITTLVFCA